MSINFNRAKLNKAKTSGEYKNIYMTMLYPPYWDDGVVHNPGCDRRKYRTWKHNRKTQWKEKN